MPPAIEIRPTDDGWLIPVLGQPGARRNAVVGIHDGRLKVAVTQVAKKGKANREILKVLAEFLNLPRGQLSVVTGETTSRKSVRITKIPLKQLMDRLEELNQD